MAFLAKLSEAAISAYNTPSVLFIWSCKPLLLAESAKRVAALPLVGIYDDTNDCSSNCHPQVSILVVSVPKRLSTSNSKLPLVPSA